MASTASPPTSRLAFRSPSGAPLEQPVEWEPASVLIDVEASRWQKVALFRQGIPLSRSLGEIEGNPTVLGVWPRSNAGHYHLRLECDEILEECTITVQPRKLTPAAFAQLLDDLERRLPAAIAIGLQRSGALTGLKIEPPGENTQAQELQRLRQAVLGNGWRPGLAAILPRIQLDPHQVLDTIQFWVGSENARRPHPSGLLQAFASSGNINSDGHPQKVLDSRVEPSLDVYENRLVNLFHQQVSVRLRRLCTVLADMQTVGFWSSSGSSAILGEARDLSRKLELSRRQASFLDSVTLPGDPTPRITMVLTKVPAYRSALEGFLEFHRTVWVRLDEPAFEAPLENLPHLYQVWGTLEAIAALLHVAVELGYRTRVERLMRRDASGLFVNLIPDGEPAVVLVHPDAGQVVKLIPERSYGKGKEFRSVSFLQRPDIAIEVQKPGETPRVYLFDPKYKLDSEDVSVGDGTPVKMDIDKMHAYRDAIRDELGHHIVRYAATIYPGTEVSYFADTSSARPDIEALRGYPGEVGLEDKLRSVLFDALAVH